MLIESCSRLFAKEAVVDLPAKGVMVMLITIAIKIVVSHLLVSHIVSGA